MVAISSPPSLPSSAISPPTSPASSLVITEHSYSKTLMAKTPSSQVHQQTSISIDAFHDLDDLDFDMSEMEEMEVSEGEPGDWLQVVDDSLRPPCFTNQFSPSPAVTYPEQPILSDKQLSGARSALEEVPSSAQCLCSVNRDNNVQDCDNCGRSDSSLSLSPLASDHGNSQCNCDGAHMIPLCGPNTPSESPGSQSHQCVLSPFDHCSSSATIPTKLCSCVKSEPSAFVSSPCVYATSHRQDDTVLSPSTLSATNWKPDRLEIRLKPGDYLPPLYIDTVNFGNLSEGSSSVQHENASQHLSEVEKNTLFAFPWSTTNKNDEPDVCDVFTWLKNTSNKDTSQQNHSGLAGSPADLHQAFDGLESTADLNDVDFKAFRMPSEGFTSTGSEFCAEHEQKEKCIELPPEISEWLDDYDLGESHQSPVTSQPPSPSYSISSPSAKYHGDSDSLQEDDLDILDLFSDEAAHCFLDSNLTLDQMNLSHFMHI